LNSKDLGSWYSIGLDIVVLPSIRLDARSKAEYDNFQQTWRCQIPVVGKSDIGPSLHHLCLCIYSLFGSRLTPTSYLSRLWMELYNTLCQRVLFLLPLSHLIAAQGCHYPNGTEVPGIDCQPCSAGKTSMCCATSRSFADNMCQSDGTCYDAMDNLIWKESCTDPNWGSGCLPLCIAGIINDLNATSTNNLIDASTLDISLTLCNDGSYYCRGFNLDCCNNNQGFCLDDFRVFLYTNDPFVLSVSTSAAASSSQLAGASTSSPTAKSILASILRKLTVECGSTSDRIADHWVYPNEGYILQC